MGRFVHRFEDQSRLLGKHDATGETRAFLGRLFLGTLAVAFVSSVAWMMATGDSPFFMRVMGHYF
ncbi:hypothetical protein SAMN06265338_101675 [Rhodoblastus acidophilus]|uniref:Uncharacterized protein n=1 Tax=Rhodoblastus acidophilus TaxID=1074 RepID=A0A212QKC8_RHOAC|nr:hypothetical protein [Rhodoblastus acidophilus]MCW2317538.1 hypothetical protein [Rhodoblastus acidophilus]PPQ39918.1 hypothetical protein CKO16_03700 [Rhodoblastus acidophilus]RAI23308.1 hypothetical protein CH337_03495 [Rhodoblastus acidophilus]SNB59799.1 hypothetical protein SAMN06265338_101675 [Rhodoblastus acidophilus]